MQNDKLDIIIEKLNSLEQQLFSIKNDLNKIANKSNDIENNCSKMKEHIDFVESVYETVKEPLNFFTNKFYYYIGNEITTIQNKE